MERLQKVIAKAGIVSRRKAEDLIANGKVKVNGLVIREMGFKVSEDDEVEVNGEILKKEIKVYYIFNKPKNTITAVSDNRERKTVLDYFSFVQERIFPVGRLDYATTGLLLLTNDGDFAHKMMHPRSHIPKTYRVLLQGIFTESMAKHLVKGIMIEGKKTLPAEVEIISQTKKKNQTVLEITIIEGRNREIRKMMEYFHCEVKELERIQYGTLTLGKLQKGEYRKLRMFEVKKLMQLADREPSR